VVIVLYFAIKNRHVLYVNSNRKNVSTRSAALCQAIEIRIALPQAILCGQETSEAVQIEEYNWSRQSMETFCLQKQTGYYTL